MKASSLHDLALPEVDVEIHLEAILFSF